MSRYRLSRRNFLSGVAGTAVWGALLSKLEAQDQGAAPPKRFLVVQRPVGTVYENWWPKGTGTSFTLSRILTPFAPLQSRMVVLRDLKLPFDGSVGGGHERGSVLLLTGARTKQLYPGNGGDDPMAEGPSVDQLFLRQSTLLQGPPIRSLQLSCDNRADTPEVSTRNIAYSGAQAPLKPYYQPQEVYNRLFSSMADASAETLERARLEKKSVLDFALRDLARLRLVAPSSQRESLDAHEMAIRELEVELDKDTSDPVSCGVASVPPLVSTSSFVDPYSGSHVVNQRDDLKHEQIAKLHFALIKAAFRCDLTRVITFQFSPGTNHVSFGDLWPPNPAQFKVHHTTSHDPDSADTLEFLTRVELWYATRVSAFLQELAQEKQADGSSLLDHTLVPYVSEVGARYHNWDNMPFVLFGGPGVKLKGGQVWANGGKGMRSTNDLWMASARAFGLESFTLGDKDQHTTAIDGLFS
ncbi:MAG: hypothetical protein RL701_5109 [Pseudomonadota bacterium]|jgi:hypothetical protein